MNPDESIKRAKEGGAGVCPQCGQALLRMKISQELEAQDDTAGYVTCSCGSAFRHTIIEALLKAPRPRRSTFPSPAAYEVQKEAWLSARRWRRPARLRNRCGCGNRTLKGESWCRDCRDRSHRRTIQGLLDRGTSRTVEETAYLIHAIRTWAVGHEFTAYLPSEDRQ